MRIEEIGTGALAKVSDQEVRSLRFRFIQLWTKFKAGVESISGFNRREFLGKYAVLRSEMARRGIEVRIPDDIDHAVEPILVKAGLWRIDVPALGEHVVVENCVSLGGSFIKNPRDAGDADVIIRAAQRDEGLELKLSRVLRPDLQGKEPHYVYSPTGPHSSYLPLFDLVLRPKAETQKVTVEEDAVNKATKTLDAMHNPVSLEIGKAALSPGRAFTPLKTQGGYGTLEFADIDPLWQTWARGYIPVPGIAVETKYDGFRLTIHAKVGGEVKLLSEDAATDLSSKLNDLAAEAKSYGRDMILDSELLLYASGEKVARKDMATYLAGKGGAFEATCRVFDCLYLDGRDLHAEPWTARQEALTSVFAKVDEKLIQRVQPTIARTEAEFRAAVKHHAEERDSEGAMLKVMTSDYPLSGKTSLWAKFKNFKELRVKVADKHAVKGGWTYDCELGGGAAIGTTYVTTVEAQLGNTLEVRVAEVKVSPAGAFTWDNPIVHSVKPAGTALTTEAEARSLSALGRTARKAQGGSDTGNISFNQGDSGTGIAQIHIMGLTEDQAKTLKAGGDRLRIARSDPARLSSVLKSLIGNAGCHVDMRLRQTGTDYWEGNEIFTGNIENIPKLKKLGEQNEKLRSSWKVGHAGEGESEIRGPLGWLEAGARGPEIFPPGQPGATANTWGAMIRIDAYRWTLYDMKSDRHSYKFHFEGGDYFSGNFLWAFVPIGGARIWMVSRLADDDNQAAAAEPKKFQKSVAPLLAFRILKVNEDQHTVGGVIYEPKVTDTQGDWTNLAEIRDAMYNFMKRYAKSPSRIKVMHEGRAYFFPVLECFQPDENTHKGGTDEAHLVKAGSWWLMIHIDNDAIWQRVKAGELGGFSMGGTAVKGNV